MPTAFTLILQMAIILALARCVGRFAKKIGQPQVVADMVTGILLGPSLLGWVAPSVSHFVFPPTSLPYLKAISEIGILLFLFLVGLSLNIEELQANRHAALLVSHTSITVPFALAAALSLLLYPRFSDRSVPFISFALFMGSTMSVTALPVLARILTDRYLVATRLGTLCISCAAIDDVTGWCILACVLVQIRARSSSQPIWITFVSFSAFLLLMMFPIRRVLKYVERRFIERPVLTEWDMSWIIVYVLGCGLATEILGVHVLFGALLAGAIIPRNKVIIGELTVRFETLTNVCLLPLYFAYTGLQTNIRMINGAQMWFWCTVITAAAILGKLGGSMLAMRAVGAEWSDATALGILMNTRGLMELVILNIGFEFGVISRSLFSIMVVMAMGTTFMATPLLKLLCPQQSLRPMTQWKEGPADGPDCGAVREQDVISLQKKVNVM